jgi:hypothetical protein
MFIVIKYCGIYVFHVSVIVYIFAYALLCVTMNVSNNIDYGSL